MAKKAKTTKTFNTGDKVTLKSRNSKGSPKRFSSEAKTTFYPVSINGDSGTVNYDTVYQVSEKKGLELVDNFSKPIPLIHKNLVNHPAFNGLFTAIKSSNKSQKKED